MKVTYIALSLATFIVTTGELPKPKTTVEIPKKIDAVTLKESIDYFADFHRIPRTLMYSSAEQESPWKYCKYQTDSTYKAHKQIGKAGELGPFQIKPNTARLVWHDNKISDKVLHWKLLHNIPYNVETAARLLEGDYDFYSRRFKTVDKIWKFTITAYNLGRYKANHIPKPNAYALSVFNRWVNKFGKGQ